MTAADGIQQPSPGQSSAAPAHPCARGIPVVLTIPDYSSGASMKSTPAFGIPDGGFSGIDIKSS
jgi:hypothetical protein